MRTLLIDAAGFIDGTAYGYNTYLLNLLNYFQRNRDSILYDQIYIACDQSQEEFFSRYSPELKVRGLNCSNYISRYWQQCRYKHIFNLNKDDLILWPSGYSSLNKQCQYILVIHDLLYLRSNLLKSLETSFTWRWHHKIFYPISIRIADKVITISKWVRKDIIEHFNISQKNIDKIEAIYSYFDFEKYNTPVKPEIKSEIKNLGEYFLVVSADYAHKNISTIIKAFSVYAELHKDSKLVIVSSLREECRGMITSLPKDICNRIVIKKNISDDELGQLYNHARAYISASEFEGLGMPLVEASYYETRVISSDIEVMREVTNGNAIYFNPKDSNELYEIMEHLDEYPQPENLREKIADIYNEDNTSRKYVEVINSFIK